MFSKQPLMGHVAIQPYILFLIGNVVDKAGSGDCFMGGLIYGLKNNHSTEEVINFAASAAVGKLQENGDSTKQTIETIKSRL